MEWWIYIIVNSNKHEWQYWAGRWRNLTSFKLTYVLYVQQRSVLFFMMLPQLGPYFLLHSWSPLAANHRAKGNVVANPVGVRGTRTGIASSEGRNSITTIRQLPFFYANNWLSKCETIRFWLGGRHTSCSKEIPPPPRHNPVHQLCV